MLCRFKPGFLAKIKLSGVFPTQPFNCKAAKFMLILCYTICLV
ncbi:hypothetical protein CAMRE0001_2849 [Campylobacter rectus RM3267]|uniref:Uncharacterized protein n=1 Tax=Campylobacter rectus RM3267 TaxID=553218 RepID=B9D634_CAMRE|nr:hypothetical protein CAMRE0001_2849 [Campylobacter rectus RM3267]